MVLSREIGSAALTLCALALAVRASLAIQAYAGRHGFPVSKLAKPAAALAFFGTLLISAGIAMAFIR